MSSVKRTNLFTPTGEVSIYRVSEETREKVAKESKMIQNKIRDTNKQSRKKVIQEEHERYMLHERERNKMIDRWKDKCKDSPYKAQHFKKELERMENEEAIEFKRQEYRRKLDILQSMTGKYQDKLVSPETISPLPIIDQLALQYRRHLKDESIVSRESQELHRLGTQELHAILQKFSHVQNLQDSQASRELRFKDMVADNVSQMSHSSSSSSYPIHSHTSSLPPAQRSNNNKAKSKGSAGKSDSSYTGSLQYRAPSSQMRQLEEDLSVEFGQTLHADSSSFTGSLQYRTPGSQMRHLEEDLSVEFAQLIHSPAPVPSTPPTLPPVITATRK